MQVCEAGHREETGRAEEAGCGEIWGFGMGNSCMCLCSFSWKLLCLAHMLCVRGPFFTAVLCIGRQE